MENMRLLMDRGWHQPEPPRLPTRRRTRYPTCHCEAPRRDRSHQSLSPRVLQCLQFRVESLGFGIQC
jgi:hypothetical protein